MWNDDMIRRAVHGSDKYPIAFLPDHLSRQGFRDIQDWQIQPASLDVRLGTQILEHPANELVTAGKFQPYVLDPGECVLGTVMERIQLPHDVVARVEGKSTWARKFLTIHSAGFIDPGFRGDITLELKNDGKSALRLQPGIIIAQISFQSLDAPATRPYGSPGLHSHYQDQHGVTGAR